MCLHMPVALYPFMVNPHMLVTEMALLMVMPGSVALHPFMVNPHMRVTKMALLMVMQIIIRHVSHYSCH